MMFDFLKGPVKAKAKAPIPPSPQENESVALFRKKWPYGVKRESNLPEAFRKTGAPEGSIQAKLNEGFSSSEPKRDFGDIEDDTLRNTFKEISRLYGGDNNALEIVSYLIPLKNNSMGHTSQALTRCHCHPAVIASSSF